MASYRLSLNPEKKSRALTPNPQKRKEASLTLKTENKEEVWGGKGLNVPVIRKKTMRTKRIGSSNGQSGRV